MVDTKRIVVGGGFRQSRVGEIAIARTGIMLKGEGFKIDLVPIRFHPDEAGLLGGFASGAATCSYTSP